MIKRLLMTVFALASLITAGPLWADCMTRSYQDYQGKTRQFVIVVPADEAKDYGTHGFAAQSCVGSDLAAMHRRACEMARAGNSAVQKRMEEVFGIVPAKVCASSRRAIIEAGGAVDLDETLYNPRRLQLRPGLGVVPPKQGQENNDAPKP